MKLCLFIGLDILAEVLFFLFGGKLGGNLLSRVASSALRAFSSSSLPHVRAAIAWSVGRSTRSFSACSLFIVFIVSYIFVKENVLINEVGNMA